MTVDFDLLQALFWSATYVLIIIFNIKYRTLGIPPIAMATNFAWETTALIRYGSVIHIAWFSLDLIIVITYFTLCKPVYFRQKFYLPILYVVEMTVFYVVFKAGGMLLSSFIIDCTMAIEYLIYILYIYMENERQPTQAPPILIALCSTKLIGDLFAWIYYKEFSKIVFVIGIVVFLLNALCLGAALLGGKEKLHHAEAAEE